MRAQQTEVLGSDIRPAELQALIAAERALSPFLFLRDGAGELRIVELTGERLVLGRAPGSDLEISWDPRVSAVHAYLERRGAGWMIEDDGLSRNGTFVCGERLRGQRLLRGGDVITVGGTLLGYRHPGPEPVAATVITPTVATPPVSEAQRRVLIELCRPIASGAHAAPATNQEIAEALTLSLATVKGHLGVLFERFGLDGLPQNHKRALLAERALGAGLVRSGDL